MNKKISFTFNGAQYRGEEGQSVAAALLNSGVTELRSTRFNGEPRTIFCGIGICFDCVVTIDGVANQRACLITISEGAKIVGSQ
jgi:aerobic-type carbon monoxide dehydrogenase small subunit (CoxS/CutS family)